MFWDQCCVTHKQAAEKTGNVLREENSSYIAWTDPLQSYKVDEHLEQTHSI